MAFNIKLLAQGQLGTTKAALYTVPASTQAIIKAITLVNTNTAAVTVNLYVTRGTASRRIIPQNLNLGVGYLLETDLPYTLEAGDIIEGDASVGAVVDYTIHGVEEV